jgi:serine palmitoyltransferase
LANGVLISRTKRLRPAVSAAGRHDRLEWQAPPALKVCVTIGLTRKEIEKAGTTIRHAITKVVGRRK